MVIPAVSGVLAIAAGAIHLAHNYLPMQAPTSDVWAQDQSVACPAMSREIAAAYQTIAKYPAARVPLCR
jgi:hypothetical protein